MVWNHRREKLSAQHVEVALVYKEMLGLDDAMRYLEQEGISKNIAERVLLTEQRRLPNGQAPAVSPTPGPFFTCRRKNRVQDAIVEAALKVPDAVAERITAPGPRQLRARNRAEPA
jgi:hypothetical protein